VALNHEGSGMWGASAEGSVPLPREILLNFQIKTAGFYAFYCKKLLVARNKDQMGA